jgi:cystathionine beta-lyase family protein involved in aluminum resistance
MNMRNADPSLLTDASTRRIVGTFLTCIGLVGVATKCAADIHPDYAKQDPACVVTANPGDTLSELVGGRSSMTDALVEINGGRSDLAVGQQLIVGAAICQAVENTGRLVTWLPSSEG